MARSDAATPTAGAADTAAAVATATATDLPLGVGGRAPGADGWPAEAPQEPGERVFAVYLAVGPEGDPVLAEATEYLHSVGYSAAEARRLACDEGAAEALGRDPEERGVAVYLECRYVGDFTSMHKDSGLGFVDRVPVTRSC